MREILFRGKDKFDGEWYAGSLSHDTKYGNCFIEVSIHQGIAKEVIPETVGQYTGLTDKNGTKIFEGDIVKTKYGRLCEVCWFSSPCSQCWDLIPIEDKHKATDEYDLWIPKNLEVIGNIHDNPERLQN